MRSVSGFVLDASLQAKFMVGHSIAVNLSMATDFSAGSNLVLDLNGFAVPAFLPNTSVQTSGDFKVATMRSDGRLIEVGTAQGFTIAPAKFQAVAVVNVTAASVIANCSVPQPVFLLSDSSVGAVSEFEILSFKTTNQIPLNGSIEFQFPPTSQSFVSGVRGNGVQVSLSWCAKRLATGFCNDTVFGTKASVNAFFNTTRSGINKFVVPVPFNIEADMIVDLRPFGTPQKFKNPTLSGSFGNAYVLTTYSEV